MKVPQFEKMTDIISEWMGDDIWVQECLKDGLTKDDIVEKASIDMIHGMMLLGGMKAIKALFEVGADKTFIKSLLDEALHNLEPDMKIEIDESI
jgi:hypothetical protein